MPATANSVVLFLATMAIRKKTLPPLLGSTTVFCPDSPLPTDSTRVSLVMNGIKRKFCHPVGKKKAVSPDLAQLILLRVQPGSLQSMNLLELCQAALFNILYFATARFEEVQALLTENI